jgi:hypothetical protein
MYFYCAFVVGGILTLPGGSSLECVTQIWLREPHPRMSLHACLLKEKFTAYYCYLKNPKVQLGLLLSKLYKTCYTRYFPKNRFSDAWSVFGFVQNHQLPHLLLLLLLFYL